MSDKDERDNRSNQLNPNNGAYYSSRGSGQSAYDDDDDYQSGPSLSSIGPWTERKFFMVVITSQGELLEIVASDGWGADPFLCSARNGGWIGARSEESLMRDHSNWASVSVVQINAGVGFGRFGRKLLGHFNGSFREKQLAFFLLGLYETLAAFVKLDGYRLPAEKERAILRRRLGYGLRQVQGFSSWLERHVHPSIKDAFLNSSSARNKIDVVVDYRDHYGFPAIMRSCAAEIVRIELELRASLEYHATGREKMSKRLNEYFETHGMPPIAAELLAKGFTS